MKLIVCSNVKMKKIVNIKRTLFTNTQKQLNDDDKLVKVSWWKFEEYFWCYIGVKILMNYLENNLSGVLITRIYVTMTELSWEHETILKNVHTVFTRI